MASPLNLSGLPIATVVAADDLMLIRKGLTDYQIAAGIVQAINIGPQFLSPIPGGSALSGDLMLISRPDIAGNYQNYNIRFNQVGVVKGTKMWFYNALPPVGWTIVPGTGGNLLAAQDFQTTYAGNVSAGNTAGTWQQTDTSLTIAQLPAHTHPIDVWKSDQEGNLSPKIGSTNKTTKNTQQTQSTGGGQGHNHGNVWRPLANVGVIGIKDG
jgi:hypothetical protein